MRRSALLLALLAPLAATPAAAQFQPGLRAPTSIRDGVGQSFTMGCYFAVSGRGANGLNIPLATEDASLRQPATVPDALRALVGSLGDNARTVVLDTPRGAVWTLFDPQTRRCLIVPEPAGAEGIEAELLNILRNLGEWREVTREGDARAFRQDFEGNRLIGARAGRMLTYYQAAQGPARPQMIVVELVSR